MFLKHTCGLSLLALALGAAASPANAQQIYRGTVNLPFETRWGGAVLQPGLHTILIEDGLNGIPLIHLRQQGHQMTVLAGQAELKPLSGSSALRLVNAGGTWRVKHLDAGAIGKSFDFLLPKVKSSKAERAAAESEKTVTISSAP